jgi:hypothetical protein
MGKMSREERKVVVQEILDNNLPFVQLTLNTSIGIFLALLAIGFEIASIIFKSPLYYIGAGYNQFPFVRINTSLNYSNFVTSRIWVGAVMFVIELITLTFSKN